MDENDLPAEAITDPATFADDKALHGLLARLRRTNPIPLIQAEGFRPFRLLTRHADIVAMELDSTRFINAPNQAVFSIAHHERSRAGVGNVQQMMRNLVAMDGDEHRAFRAIAHSQFLSKAINALRPEIEALAEEFVERMAWRGSACDFSADIAMWYPLRVIMSIIGVPAEDEERMLGWTQKILSSQDPEFQTTGEKNALASAMLEMFQYFQPVIADRRQNPRDDIASAIATALIDGQPLADRDVFGYFLILATAGHDTTSYSLAGGMLALLQNPNELAKLRADPSLLPSAADEMIRWSSPVRHFARTATQDCEFQGQAIKAGDIFMLCYPSANRDAEIFEDPFAFRVDRKPNRHLAFGTGPHLCLGQHLAKLELTLFLRAFLGRVEHVELTGTPRYTESTFVGGVKQLPIRYQIRASADAL